MFSKSGKKINAKKCASNSHDHTINNATITTQKPPFCTTISAKPPVKTPSHHAGKKLQNFTGRVLFSAELSLAISSNFTTRYPSSGVTTSFATPLIASRTFA
jgi:hypothetical protein